MRMKSYPQFGKSLGEWVTGIWGEVGGSGTMTTAIMRNRLDLSLSVRHFPCLPEPLLRFSSFLLVLPVVETEQGLAIFKGIRALLPVFAHARTLGGAAIW